MIQPLIAAASLAARAAPATRPYIAPEEAGEAQDRGGPPICPA